MDDNKKPRSLAARELSRIKSATIAAAEKRAHLPQPLFWSLFHTALDEVRKSKAQERALSEILDS